VGVKRVVMGLGRLLQSTEERFMVRERGLSGLVLGEIKERGRRWICSCPWPCWCETSKRTEG
jgi:hypothetical protein